MGDFLDRFLGLERSTYFQVNTVNYDCENSDYTNTLCPHHFERRDFSKIIYDIVPHAQHFQHVKL